MKNMSAGPSLRLSRILTKFDNDNERSVSPHIFMVMAVKEVQSRRRVRRSNSSGSGRIHFVALCTVR